MRKAFTLAEILIVLTIIGILTAILLPAAFHSTPDQNVMKFKKCYSTLGTVIRELVSSDKYYYEGDLGMKTTGVDSGTLITSSMSNYFCKSLADLLNVKNDQCTGTVNKSKTGWRNIKDKLEQSKSEFDSDCNITPTRYITTSDGVSWFEANNEATFGILDSSKRRFNGPVNVDADGFDTAYKIICIDVDGLGDGEVPFGFGIRADGKILPGKRAQEWNEKSIQQEN